MNNEDVIQEKYYTSKEVCARLDIADSTLRKWSISLEKNGYSFARGEQNRRLFLEDNLVALDHLKVLVQEKRMSLDNASIIVTSKFVDDRSSERTPSVPAENSNPSVRDALQKHIKKQEYFNQELLKRLDEQNQYINNRLDQRDEALMETMNKMIEQRQEDRKLLEEANERKSNWFTRLFNK